MVARSAYSPPSSEANIVIDLAIHADCDRGRLGHTEDEPILSLVFTVCTCAKVWCGDVAVEGRLCGAGI
jgi:hypothetical protein